MTVKTVPRRPVSGSGNVTRITTHAEDSPREQATLSPVLPANGTAEKEIRIHRDGLLIAKCYAIGLAPSRLFIAIDPLHYPVNSRLEIEFVNSTGATAKSVRLPATVTKRSAKGVELRLDTEASRQVNQRPA